MPAPRNISLTLDGGDSFSAAPLWAWQANPLTLTCALAASLSLIDGAVTFVAEIHATAAPGGSAPLATASADAGDDAEFSFDTGDMSFGIGSNVVSAIRFLFITARDVSGNELQTLYARKMVIKANGYSGVAAEVATGSSVVRLVSATPDDDGMHTFTALGKTWRDTLNDFDDA